MYNKLKNLPLTVGKEISTGIPSILLAQKLQKVRKNHYTHSLPKFTFRRKIRLFFYVSRGTKARRHVRYGEKWEALHVTASFKHIANKYYYIITITIHRFSGNDRRVPRYGKSFCLYQIYCPWS